MKRLSLGSRPVECAKAVAAVLFLALSFAALLWIPACGTMNSNSADASTQSMDTGNSSGEEAQSADRGGSSDTSIDRSDANDANDESPSADTGVQCGSLRCVPPMGTCCETPPFMTAFNVGDGSFSSCASSASECPCNETSCPAGQVCCGDKWSLDPSTKCVATGTCAGCQLCARSPDGGNNCAAGQVCSQFGDQPSFCFGFIDDAGTLTCGDGSGGTWNYFGTMLDGGTDG